MRTGPSLRPSRHSHVLADDGLQVGLDLGRDMVRVGRSQGPVGGTREALGYDTHLQCVVVGGLEQVQLQLPDHFLDKYLYKWKDKKHWRQAEKPATS